MTAKKPAPRKRNVAAATTIGATVGAVAIPAINWGSAVIELKTGIPAVVTQPLLGSAAAVFMRWAAKLDPHA